MEYDVAKAGRAFGVDETGRVLSLYGGVAGADFAGGYDFWLVKTGVESGLAWTDSTANSITLYRGATDAYWNYVRVRIWKIKETPYPPSLL